MNDTFIERSHTDVSIPKFSERFYMNLSHRIGIYPSKGVTHSFSGFLGFHITYLIYLNN